MESQAAEDLSQLELFVVTGIHLTDTLLSEKVTAGQDEELADNCVERKVHTL